MALIRIAGKQDVPEGTGKAFELNGRRIAVFNVQGKFYAIDDTCTHSGGPLSEGDLEGTKVICPWHGAEFDLGSGQNVSPPAPQPVHSYRVEVDGDDLKIEL